MERKEELPQPDAKRERVCRLQVTHPAATEYEGSLEGWKASLTGTGPSMKLPGAEPGRPLAFAYICNLESFHGEPCVGVGISDGSSSLAVLPLAVLRAVLRDYDSEAITNPAVLVVVR